MGTFIFIVIRSLLINIAITLSHPISLGIVIIGISVIIGVYILNLVYSWFFYLLILVFFRGVIVLIIYIRTLSANEKFSPMVVTLPLFVLLALIMSITSNSLTQSFSNRVTSRSFISQLCQHKNARLLLFLIVYLLITLVCVVKLVKYEEGPLSKRL